MDLRQQNKLLYSRACFGISLTEFQEPRPIAAVVEGLFPKTPPTELIAISEKDWLDHSPEAMKLMGNEVEKREKQKAFRQRTRDINLLWLQAMVDSQYPLVEKAALFWHGHFATRIDNPYYDQRLLQILRTNALGNFGELLREVSKSAAMLQFLNNQQNKKAHPNENFAREVMELFTLGRGHYTEDDVKEAARAFTGWAHDGTGEFIFRKKQHDDGKKKFLGKTGYFNGDDILDILLEQKQTAVFITQKIYRYFVSDEKIDEKRVRELADDFYESKYDIGALLKTIFSSDWFYGEHVTGAKVKSPVELLVGYQRLMPLQFAKPQFLLSLQRLLGQVLFAAPNVAGWPGGKNWIDSSSLALRMRLPEALFASGELDLSPKDHDPEAMSGAIEMDMETYNNQRYRMGKTVPDWTQFLAAWSVVGKDALLSSLADYLLNIRLSEGKLNEVNSFADHFNTNDFIKSVTILLMELPEYQLS